MLLLCDLYRYREKEYPVDKVSRLLILEVLLKVTYKIIKTSGYLRKNNMKYLSGAAARTGKIVKKK